jgi:hypothetical protein
MFVNYDWNVGIVLSLHEFHWFLLVVHRNHLKLANEEWSCSSFWETGLCLVFSSVTVFLIKVCYDDRMLVLPMPHDLRLKKSTTEWMRRIGCCSSDYKASSEIIIAENKKTKIYPVPSTGVTNVYSVCLHTHTHMYSCLKEVLLIWS